MDVMTLIVEIGFNMLLFYAREDVKILKTVQDKQVTVRHWVFLKLFVSRPAMRG